MKKIYLLVVHKDPKQVERQINALSDEHSYFYIHVDLKSDIHSFRNLERIKNVFLIKERVDCIWGDFSQVMATLNLIDNAINNHRDGYCILMSGSDYPLKAKEDIHSFLAENYQKIFIDCTDAYSNWPEFHKRIEYYRINMSSRREDALMLKPGVGLHFIRTLYHFLRGRLSIRNLYQITCQKRVLRLNLKFHGGSSWWAMNIPDLVAVNDYINTNKKELFEFFQYSTCSDEFFFHSIIMHVFQNEITSKFQGSLTHVDWSRKNCPLPVTFSVEDLDELTNLPSHKLFARKFDMEMDEEILNKIDERISQGVITSRG
jgi:hypothetical protein